ncbi:CBS domain-containing protein [Diplocarpon rosae]|nr:CBS domain-containing protein [Diplocarpon rosae]
MKWSTTKHKLLHRKLRCEERSVLPASNQKFDESSGQIYTETIISMQSREDRNWSQRIRNKPVTLDPHHGAVRAMGSRSLRDTAIEAIVGSLADLTLEWVEELPIHLKCRIWKLANERYTVPLQVWILFSKVLKKESGIPLNLLRYRETIEFPRLPLGSYTTALISPNFEFLASLSITTIFPVPQLVKLSHLTNLVVLEIVHTAGATVESGVSDRLVRTWHEAAISEAAFRVLRILKLWNHIKVTSKSLSYINAFPALALYDLRGCNLEIEARGRAKLLGWKSSLEPGTLALFEAMCVEQAMGMRVSDGNDTLPIRRAPSHQLQDDSIIGRLARGDVREFLTRPSLSVKRSSPDGIPQWEEIQKAIDYLARDRPLFPFTEMRFGYFNRDSMNKASPAYKTETWDFDLYTILSRIGELRMDQDLRLAGLDVTDQVIVKGELVNSVPLASIRLGPSPAYLHPARQNNQINSFYGSMYSSDLENQMSRLLLNWADNPRPAGWDQGPRPRPDHRNVSFVKIISSGADNSCLLVPVADEARSGILKRGSSAISTVKNRSSKLIQNKKQKLSDVLGSFI